MMMDDTLEVDVFRAGDDGVCEYRIPAMITTVSGTLVASCDARVDRPGDAINNIDQVCKRSIDGGSTWSRMISAAVYPGDEAAGDPSLLQGDATGRIWLFYTHCPGENPGADGPTERRRILRLTCVFSDDDGENWSSPRYISGEVGRTDADQLWPGPGRGLQTRSGRLIIPCSAIDEGGLVQRACLVTSDDHGESWQVSASIGEQICEPTIVELDDGSYLVNARSNRGRGCRAIVTSNDEGASWSAITDDPTLIEPVCQGSFLRIPDGRLLFSNPATSDRGDRRNMTVRLSENDGRSWKYTRRIYAGPSRYSCLTVLPDGSIGLLYERDSVTSADMGEMNKQISLRRFTVDWLTI